MLNLIIKGKENKKKPDKNIYYNKNKLNFFMKLNGKKDFFEKKSEK